MVENPFSGLGLLLIHILSGSLEGGALLVVYRHFLGLLVALLLTVGALIYVLPLSLE